MFAYAYNNISNPFETSRKQSDNKENIQAVAETPATAPLETAPTETTIEVTTTTPETIPATTAIEQTTTTAEVTTTTEEPSLYEKVLVGQADRNELSGNLIAQIDIPSLCLKGIDAYGSQTRDNNDVEVLDYFLAQGLLDETQYKLLLSPKPPKEVIVQFKDLFNPIYKTYAAETPQEACETVGPNAKYPPRWERTFIDSSDKDVETEPVVNYEPVVDVDWQKALPGEPGNVVIVGHRTTKSAPFANLDQAKIGDPVVIRTNDGQSHTYVVEGSRYIIADTKEYNHAVDEYVSPSGNTATLALVTCDDNSKQRLIVYAALQA
jgi:LPXTG-site transpeptidase (sortase) family protein